MDNGKLTDKNRKLLPAKLLEYYDHITELIHLDDMNITSKAKISSSIHHGILTNYYAEVELLKRMREYKEKLLNKKVEEVLNGDPESLIATPSRPKPRVQMINELQETDEFLKLNKKIDDQQIVVNYLKDELPILAGFNFTVNTSKELLKLENG